MKLHEDRGWASNFPGKSGSWNPADMFAPAHSPFGHMATNPIARRFGTRMWQGIGEGMTYSTLDWTVTTTGTSAAAAFDTSGGVLLTCGSDSTFNTNLQSKTLWSPIANTWIAGGWVVQASSITTVGLECGFGSSAVDPATTDYTDVIGFKMAVGAGAVIGKVRGDSGTVANSATLTTLAAATDAYLGFYANLGVPVVGAAATTVTAGTASATQTVGNTAGYVAGDVLYFATTAVYRVIQSITNATTVVLTATITTTTAEVVTQFRPVGVWYAGTNYQTATVTPFTANQLIQAARLLSTPVSMYHNLSAKGSASTPTILYKVAHLERDSVG